MTIEAFIRIDTKEIDASLITTTKAAPSCPEAI
jgi:hypothetical protein